MIPSNCLQRSTKISTSVPSSSRLYVLIILYSATCKIAFMYLVQKPLFKYPQVKHYETVTDEKMFPKHRLNHFSPHLASSQYVVPHRCPSKVDVKVCVAALDTHQTVSAESHQHQQRLF